MKAIKNDSEKIRVDLLSTLALEEIAKVLTYGAKKYAADNWRYGFTWRRLLGAAQRHLYAFMRGEDIDPESGLPHLAHLGCCVLFLLEFYLTANGTDDRWNERAKMPQRERSRKNLRGRNRQVTRKGRPRAAKRRVAQKGKK